MQLQSEMQDVLYRRTVFLQCDRDLVTPLNTLSNEYIGDFPTG